MRADHRQRTVATGTLTATTSCLGRRAGSPAAHPSLLHPDSRQRVDLSMWLDFPIGRAGGSRSPARSRRLAAGLTAEACKDGRPAGVEGGRIGADWPLASRPTASAPDGRTVSAAANVHRAPPTLRPRARANLCAAGANYVTSRSRSPFDLGAEAAAASALGADRKSGRGAHGLLAPQRAHIAPVAPD